MSGAKRTAVRAGRRSGKTAGQAIKAGKRFLEDARVLYAAPTSDQLAAFWTLVKVMFADAIEAGAYHVNESEHVLERPLLRSRSRVRIPSQNRIRAKTAWNADTLRGDYGDELMLDEFQLMNEDAWGEVGAPMLLDNNGNVTICFTPPSLHARSTSKARDKLHAVKFYRDKQEDPRWETHQFTSHDNPHISAEALDEISQDMTAMAYRQEILAEDVDEAPASLWKRAMFERDRYRAPPDLERVVVAIDPTGSRSGDEVGIIVAGLGVDGAGYVLADESGSGLSPDDWARRAVRAYYTWRADRIVAEVNFGGDMVENTLRVVDPNVPYKAITASRGKAIRAEPVAALYEREGRVYHSAEFEDLESQLCLWQPDSRWSPDRLDALVMALTELMIEPVFRWGPA